MKRLFLLFSLFLISLISVAQGNQTTITVPTNSSGTQTFPALLFKPDDYATTTGNYPLIIFLHGAGEAGTSLSKIYNNSSAGGPAYFIAQNQWPASFTNPANGQQYKFIVVSPQSPGWSTSTTQLNYIINSLVNTYRVDINRIYLTGLSAGGEGVVGYVVHQDLETGATVNPMYKAAAVVPMSAAISNPPQSFGNTIVTDGVKPWGFGSVPADIHGEFTFQLINRVNDAQAGYGRFTNYNGGHCCWNTFYTPTYRENINNKSMNIYEWMLQYSRGSNNPPPQNQVPIANAGPNSTITLPINYVTLSGSGSDADGTIASYNWTKVSGPSQFTIVSPTQAQTVINNLVQGTYQFQLKVNDNLGAIGIASVIITVNASSTPAPNQPPVALAGTDQAITLPANAVTMNGNGTDADGSIASYNWTKISGPTQFTISNPNIKNPLINNLVAGTYIFRLTVKDNIGAAGVDDVSVLVNPVSGNGKFIPGKIEAENYDNMSGVAKQTTSDIGGGQNVGWIETGDWMDYNVTVNTGGNYTVNFRIASPNTGTQLQLKKGTTILTSVNIPKTGSWQTWQTVSANVTLVAGAQTIRIHALKGGWNFNWFEFLQTQTQDSAKYVKVNLYVNNPYSNSEWNNWNLISLYNNISSPLFKYSNGTSSSINAVLSRSDEVGDNGSTYTGSMAPGNVLRYASYSSQQRTLTINGLTAGKTYAIELYASRNINAANSTVYSVNGNNITIASYNNLTNKASFYNIMPDAQGKMTIGINNVTTYNYINGFILTETSGNSPLAKAGLPESNQQSEELTVSGDITDRFVLQVNKNITGLMSIQIIDMLGIIQKEFNVLKSEADPTQVYLSAGSLTPGEYVIKVQIDKWTSSIKILKTK